MEQVRISRIEFINYRQYGTGSLVFPHSAKYELTAFIARNGTGKTTLLNALTWCLYGKEKLLDVRQTDKKIGADESLPLLNTKVLNESEVGKNITVGVNVTIVDSEKTILFKRTQICQIRERNGIKDVIALPGEFSATTTPFKRSNSVVRNDSEAAMLVKQYFDEDIFNFYFFDGENLKYYFEPQQASLIKGSIYNISQIDLLENVISRIGVLQKEAQKKIGKGFPDLEQKMKTAQEVSDEIQKYYCDADREEQKENAAKEEIDRIQELINQVKPGEELLKRRAALVEKLKDIETEQAELDNDRSLFVRKYITLLSFYPRIKTVLELIEEKEKNSELPPSIDKIAVQRLIDHKDEKCPVCDQPVGDEAIKHLQHLIEKLTVSQGTSARLMEIKYPLYQLAEEAKDYPRVRDELQQRQSDIYRSKEDATSKLKAVKDLLGTRTESVDENGVTVASLNADLAREERNRQAHHDIVVRLRTLASTKEKELEKLHAEIEELQKKANTNALLQKEFEEYSALMLRFKQIRDSITDRMRFEIERYTSEIFRDMSSKTRTFGKVSIDENYHVSVYNIEGHPMTSNLSDTEKMALAYAYTLAIHRASGKNCPLVIDSPLGRVSDNNRKNMATVFLDLSQKKQLIMCFTPDEFSDNIKPIFSKIDKRELRLGDDEKTIETGLVR